MLLQIGSTIIIDDMSIVPKRSIVKKALQTEPNRIEMSKFSNSRHKTVSNCAGQKKLTRPSETNSNQSGKYSPRLFWFLGPITNAQGKKREVAVEWLI